MIIKDYLHIKCIAADTKISDKTNALREIARLAKNNPVLAGIDEETIFNELQKREELGTTGFGDRIAIPHCRLEGISTFVVGILRVPEGVDFQAMDNKPVNLILFIIAPEGVSEENIRLLSLISQTLKVPETVNEIIAQQSPEEIRDRFLNHTIKIKATRSTEKKKLFQVVIQDEEIFNDILQIFEAIESDSVVVFEARNIREFLVNMPLFTSFMGDEYLGKSRIVQAVVDSSLTNPTLRAIENITGDLHQCTDVMVLIQDILYTAGSLET